MKKFIICLVIVIQVGILLAQTSIEGDVAKAKDAEDNSYNVTENVNFSNGQTLTIESDVTAQLIGNVTSELQRKMDISSDKEFIRVNICLSDNYNSQKLILETSQMTKHEKREYVISNLKELSANSQVGLISQLNELATTSKVRKINPLWIANIVNCEMTKRAIEILSARGDIESIDYDDEKNILLSPIINHDSSENLNKTRNNREITWNVTKVNADDVWNMGYSGSGVVVAMLYTGVNYNHTDLNDHLWTHPDYPNHGYDFINGDNDPMDDHGHGTLCAGIVTGDGTSGFQTGISPDAELMCLKLVTSDETTTESACWAAIQFAVDYGADVLNIPFGLQHDQMPDRTAWRDVMNNVLITDIIAVVPVGNLGESQVLYPIPDNVGTPADCPPPWLHPDQTLQGGLSSVVCVGATNMDDELYSFSSRGPVTWENVAGYNDYAYNPEMGLIRPDISAPGGNIKSLSYDNNTGYEDELYGTHLASSCAAGVIALMLSRNYDLTPTELDQIIEENAAVSQSPKNNDLGSGRIDALASIDEVPILQIVLTNPNGEEYLVSGNSDSITWGSTLVSDIKIEYSIDNGSTWIEIIVSTSAVSRTYEWTVPNIVSDQCKIKLTDVSNAANYDESDAVFEIGPENPIGGPYLVDDNTVLLS